ncbi:hypothetical protein BJ322DRAFT_1064894 [Thelephora terrestris]|uniref:Uncharacterized protein n=1 Tax=Thelephora terrestris TaxID=56493 RepID=A0A9P6HF07_9AGAM|nr:hypothetical protein BJ322DRAFT_1064894 [Thelephora terrestris]
MSPFWVLYPPITYCVFCGLPTAFGGSITLRQIVEIKKVLTTKCPSERIPKTVARFGCLVRLEDIPSVCIVDETFRRIIDDITDHPNVAVNRELWAVFVMHC